MTKQTSDLDKMVGFLDATGSNVQTRYGFFPTHKPNLKKGCPTCDFMGFLPDGACPDCPEFEVKLLEAKLNRMKSELE